jgi:hypothetical protein
MGRFIYTIGKNAWDAAVTVAWVVVVLVGVGVVAHLARNLVVYGWNLIS